MYYDAPYKQDGSNSITTDRRTHLAQQITALSTLSIIGSHRPPANAAEVDVITQLQNSLEERLANSNAMSPSYGMEISDIFYPSSFQGSWNVLSKTVDIIAPCGYELFTGGDKGYKNAVKEITDPNNDLRYRARFIPSGDEDGTCIADREYNAKEIAKAAMGDYSVIDTPVAQPNRYSCLLAPPGNTNNLISVDIIANKRKAEATSSPDTFVCSEFVRQIVSPAQKNNPNAPPVPPLSIKDIETISMYAISKDKITCRQKTATFLVPSQTDPIAFKKWQLSQGKAVDVRYYDVTYTRAS